MNIATLGTGLMGGGLAVLVSKAGHEVTLVSRDVLHVSEKPEALGGNDAGDPIAA